MLNSFTGLTGDMPKAPQIASNFFRYKQLIPSLTVFGSPGDAHGIVVDQHRRRASRAKAWRRASTWRPIPG